MNEGFWTELTEIYNECSEKLKNNNREPVSKEDFETTLLLYGSAYIDKVSNDRFLEEIKNQKHETKAEKRRRRKFRKYHE